MSILHARGVVRAYGHTPALRGVTLNLAEGEIVAVTGPSGCGKSTLLHCMAGILRPDAGEVIYRDQRIDTLSEGERSRLRRTEFGVLFQFGQLVSELTTAENVALPLLLAGTGRRAARTAALSWLDRWVWRTWPISVRGRCPGASSSAARWPGRWLPSRGYCSATSRPAHWTRSPASRCSAIWYGLPASSAPPCCWSPTTRGWPGTRTARSRSATARWTRAVSASR